MRDRFGYKSQTLFEFKLLLCMNFLCNHLKWELVDHSDSRHHISIRTTSSHRRLRKSCFHPNLLFETQASVRTDQLVLVSRVRIGDGIRSLTVIIIVSRTLKYVVFKCAACYSSASCGVIRGGEAAAGAIHAFTFEASTAVDSSFCVGCCFDSGGCNI